MTYKDSIKEWYKRSLSEDDLFVRYILIYISFIAFLSQRKPGPNDRSRIDSVKYDSNAKAYYLGLVDSDPEIRSIFTNLIKELDSQPIGNLTKENDKNWKGKDGVLTGVEDWENLVEFWYRVRNNLFHGHKSPEFERDKKLVEYAFLTLQPLMKNFIDNDLTWVSG